jgi:hypothetical protein
VFQNFRVCLKLLSIWFAIPLRSLADFLVL